MNPNINKGSTLRRGNVHKYFPSLKKVKELCFDEKMTEQKLGEECDVENQRE